MTERPLKTVNPHLLDPKTYVDDKIVFRNYRLSELRFAHSDRTGASNQSPIWDIQLAF